MATAMIPGSDELSFRLQQALLEHHVRLEPVQITPEEKLLDDDPRLRYIRDLLEDEECFNKELEAPQQRPYLEIMNELTALISNPSSSSSLNTSPGSLSPLFPVAAPPGTGAFANWCGSSPSFHTESSSNLSLSSEELSKKALESLLIRCARAVSARDSPRVYKLVGELRSLTTPPTTWLQQLAVYFTDALIARLTDYGAQMHSTMYRQEVTQKQAIISQMNLPTLRATERYANQVILEQCRGAKQVHIIDYGILYGCQWPSLIKALSEREGGPPQLMITGVDFPHILYAGSQTGPKLVQFAKACGVSLQFHRIGSSSWEVVQPKHHLENELLIANCKLRMRNLRDDGIPESPRKAFFRNIMRMQPALFVQCVVSVEFCSPLFLQRFQMAWAHFSVKYEYMVESMKIIDASKLDHLSKFLAKTIMNIVACEGADRIERMSSHKTWNSLATNAGLESLPLSGESIAMALSAWSGIPGFTSGFDGNWLLLGSQEKRSSILNL